MRNYRESYEKLIADIESKNVDIDVVKDCLKKQHIETPSWGYGNSGTRFKTFNQPGAATNVFEKLKTRLTCINLRALLLQ